MEVPLWWYFVAAGDLTSMVTMERIEWDFLIGSNRNIIGICMYVCIYIITNVVWKLIDLDDSGNYVTWMPPSEMVP